MDLSPSWQTTRIHVVLATGVTLAGAKEQDEAEDIRVHLVPIDRVRQMIAEGGIRNAVTIVGLSLLEAKRR